MCGASSGSCKGGERSAVDGQGRARTCCCFSRSVVTLLTPLGELGSVRDADLEQRWGRDGQGSDHRPHCGHDMYYTVGFTSDFLSTCFLGTSSKPATTNKSPATAFPSPHSPVSHRAACPLTNHHDCSLIVVKTEHTKSTRAGQTYTATGQR